MIEFSQFNLHKKILEALDAKGYKNPTPIQEKSIPHLLKGVDLLGIAQTGTGKTAAFSLPLINRLAAPGERVGLKNCKALILTPTRELASQIEQNIKAYSQGLAIRTLVVFGGVGHKPQIMALAKGVDILVATPGRLLEMIEERHIRFDQLEVFILDEADRMLDMGFFNDVKKVISHLPTKKQTLLFSATMPIDIAKLASTLLKDPVRVEVTPQSTTVERIEQKIYLVAKTNKAKLLEHLLENPEIKSVLLFSRTKHGADRIVKALVAKKISCAAIHGNKSQNAREEALSSFRKGKIRVLIATDIAARGIDVDHVTHVVNFSLPDDPKNYVHRIGRTARAGREGIAISFCDETEGDLLRGIEKLTKQKIDIEINHPYHGVEGFKITPSKPRGKTHDKPAVGANGQRPKRTPTSGPRSANEPNPRKKKRHRY